MNGLMMDFQLTIPHLLQRAETYFGEKEIVTRLPDQQLPPLHVRRHDAAREAARRRAQGPRPGAGRPRRDALLEPLPAHGGVLRHPVRRLRAPHAEPAPALRRRRLHREARRRPRADRRPVAAAARRAVQGRHRHRARLRRRGLVRGTARGRERRRLARSRARRGHRRGDVLHERHDRDAEGRRLLAPLDRAAHARRRRRQSDVARHFRAGRDPARRADVPRERVGLPVPRRDARVEARVSRASASTRSRCSRTSCRRASRGRRACRRSGWASSRCSTRIPARGICRG